MTDGHQQRFREDTLVSKQLRLATALWLIANAR
jgi:hypothetical protein